MTIRSTPTALERRAKLGFDGASPLARSTRPLLWSIARDNGAAQQSRTMSKVNRFSFMSFANFA
jgi:hypothetical protein